MAMTRDRIDLNGKVALVTEAAGNDGLATAASAWRLLTDFMSADATRTFGKVARASLE